MYQVFMLCLHVSLLYLGMSQNLEIFEFPQAFSKIEKYQSYWILTWVFVLMITIEFLLRIDYRGLQLSEIRPLDILASKSRSSIQSNVSMSVSSNYVTMVWEQVKSHIIFFRVYLYEVKNITYVTCLT